MQNSMTTVGRIVFGLPFIMFGVTHFMMGSKMAGIVPGWLPAPTFWVFLTGAALIAAGIAIAADRFREWAGLGLAVLLATFVLTVHLPGFLAGGEGAQQSMASLLKDAALAGGALINAGLGRAQASDAGDGQPETA